MTSAERIISVTLHAQLARRPRGTGVLRLTEGRRYSLEELVELRQKMVRYARSFPPGHERNQYRQTAMSLRDLFENKKWLEAHIGDGQTPIER